MTDHSSHAERQWKRPKYMSDWEQTLYNGNNPPQGIQELFDAPLWLDSRTRRGSCSKRPLATKKTTPEPLTFRLERREAGALATHPGEERILLFRSDRKGAIGKIIYSPTEGPQEAKIHVLDVKGEYRGMDFGGLLFSEALLALQEKQTTRCLLDAEEDVRRHNKLVGFYERLGCHVKPKVRPQFINNNDGETYRKVPMQIDLNNNGTRLSKGNDNRSLVGSASGFLPVALLGSPQEPCKLGDTPHLCWLMTDDGNGQVQFRTSQGRYLTVDAEGRCGEDQAGETPSDHLSSFQLIFIPEDEGDEEARTEKELWILRSPHGTFLSLDPDSKELEASKTPAFWQANSRDQLSLTCVWDTPTRRQHYRKTWSLQTVDYVRSMKKQYLQFQMARLSLREALDRIKAFPAFPFRLDAASKGISMRTLCFHTAEAARAAGHPDWIQFVALIHAVGTVAKSIHTKTAVEAQDEYDWTAPCKARVVGCASSADSTFAEFARLNPDERDERYNTATGMYKSHCGLENVLLTWSGTEYLYHCLRHNDVDLPEEGLAVLRLFPLFDWHSKKMYDNLANQDDHDIRSFVRDFDQIRRQASASVSKELTDAECDHLWTSHYDRLAAKFGVEDVLEW